MTGFALLGCGRIGGLHARNIAAHPRAELAACYDVAAAAAEAVARDTGARAVGSVDEALLHPRVRAVLIASSTDTHAELIVRSVRAGKAVLCEKPIDLSMARVEACWREIAPLRPLVALGFNRRFDPSFKALRDRLRAGEIGALEQVVITGRDPAPPPAAYVAVSGGLFRDMTIHDFDMARYLAGDVTEVHALGANHFDPAIRDADDIDAAMITLRAASGALVHINNSRRCAYGYDQHIEAFGERGIADPLELARAASLLRGAERPLIVAGGGVLYSGAAETLRAFAARHRVPVAETQAGKGAMPWDHPQAVGSIGVTGSSAANALAGEADVVLAVGTRLQDFTTGSRALLPGRAGLIGLNVAAFDAGKHGAAPLVGDARRTLDELGAALGGYAASPDWQRRTAGLVAEWNAAVEAAVAPGNLELPTDAQVIGAVNRAAGSGGIVVCAAGGLPGELHKLWRTSEPGGYHLEYGFSCMGYEIAGGLGVKMAHPDRDVFVMVGDGSYLMLNSELQTSVMLGRKLVVTVLDNRGYGCIDRLQRACGGAPFNNLIEDVDHRADEAWVDFAAHARSLGARAEAVDGIAGLEAALARAKAADRTCVIVIRTDPARTTQAGGAWWDVAVPQVSERGEVQDARAAYVRARAAQAAG